MVTLVLYEDKVTEFHRRLGAFEKLCRASGLTIRKTCGFRSNDAQKTLYSIGRTRPGRVVTKARPGQSPHNWELAADYAILVKGKCDWNSKSARWNLFGMLAKKCLLTWGGNFPGFRDCPHVQMPNWRKFLP
jgi:peptidoglycan L-alanyl-D-glutamate endopeptidase CwlK